MNFLLLSKAAFEEIKAAHKSQVDLLLSQLKESESERKHLLDQILIKQHAEPVQIENRKVITINNDPTPESTPLDYAFGMDDILEELELKYPEVTGMHYEDVKRLYPREWQAVEKRLAAEKAPLVE